MIDPIQMATMSNENTPSIMPDPPILRFAYAIVPKMTANIPQMSPSGAVSSNALSAQPTIPRINPVFASPSIRISRLSVNTFTCLTLYRKQYDAASNWQEDNRINDTLKSKSKHSLQLHLEGAKKTCR